MNKTQAKRLLNVAKSLRESKNPKQFTMEKYVWGESFHQSLAWQTPPQQAAEQNFCGTPACALGHYASRRDLQKLLKVNITKKMVNDELLPVAAVSYLNNQEIDFCSKKFRDHFGIDEQEADSLFSGFGCGDAQTPIQAARYIERFVKIKLATQKSRY